MSKKKSADLTKTFNDKVKAVVEDLLELRAKSDLKIQFNVEASRSQPEGDLVTIKTNIPFHDPGSPYEYRKSTLGMIVYESGHIQAIECQDLPNGGKMSGGAHFSEERRKRYEADVTELRDIKKEIVRRARVHGLLSKQ